LIGTLYKLLGIQAGFCALETQSNLTYLPILKSSTIITSAWRPRKGTHANPERKIRMQDMTHEEVVSLTGLMRKIDPDVDASSIEPDLSVAVTRALRCQMRS